MIDGTAVSTDGQVSGTNVVQCSSGYVDSPYLLNDENTVIGSEKKLTMGTTVINSHYSGTYYSEQEIMLSPIDSSYTIRYTTDGKDPLDYGLLYSLPFKIYESTNLRIVTIKGDTAYEVDYTYILDKTKAAAPTADPSSGAVIRGSTVTLSTATEGASIYYTIDGSIPNAESIKYTNPIIITNAVTIKAIAISEDSQDSDISQFVYTILEVADPYAMTVTNNMQVSGSKLTGNLSIDIVNNTETTQDAAVIFAVYQNGKLISLQINDKHLLNIGSTIFDFDNIDIALSATDTYEIKILLWKSLDSMEALVECEQIILDS